VGHDPDEQEARNKHEWRPRLRGGGVGVRRAYSDSDNRRGGTNEQDDPRERQARNAIDALSCERLQVPVKLAPWI
jgi:hypothetical protein